MNLGYKGILLSETTLPHPLKTDWEGLKEIYSDITNPHNFSYFYLRNSLEKRDEGDWRKSISLDRDLATTLTEWRQKLYSPHEQLPFLSEFLKLTLSTDCPEKCQRQKKFSKSRESKCSQIPTCHNQLAFARLLSKIFRVCEENLPQLITKELNSPKTVFLIPSGRFEFYWNIWRREMRKDPRLKFAHYGATHRGDDNAVGDPEHYLFPTAPDSRRPFAPQNRLKLLLQSGIHAFWRKWDNLNWMRKKLIEEEFIDEPRRLFSPLSFRDIEIHLIFYLWGFFSLGTLGIFVGEFIYFRHWDILYGITSIIGVVHIQFNSVINFVNVILLMNSSESLDQVSTDQQELHRLT